MHVDSIGLRSECRRFDQTWSLWVWTDVFVNNQPSQSLIILILTLFTFPFSLQGFAIPEDKQKTTVPFVFENEEYTLNHGAVVIAAITSCTNTSNPSVMLGAGMSSKSYMHSSIACSK